MLKLHIKQFSGGLSPPMVVLKEHVVEMKWLSKSKSFLTHVRWNIALLIDDAWSNLGDVHVNHETVVGIDLKKLILSQVSGINVVLNVAMLVR